MSNILLVVLFLEGSMQIVWSVNRDFISISLWAANTLEKILSANNIFAIYIWS